MKQTVGTLRFADDGDFVVDIEKSPFGETALLACFDARRLHPFTSQASDPWLFDLLDFCIAYYALDRFTPRPEVGWSRPFVLKLPVHDPPLWRQHAPLVREWIYALTNDDVEIVPYAREKSASHHVRPLHLTLDDHSDVVGLVSEGLDSLCGVDSAIRSADRRISWASITSGTKLPRIKKTVDFSCTMTGRRIPHFKIRMSLRNGNKAQEKTQRSRTVLAVVMALTTAYALGAAAVECYENGIGLLNLPVPDLQFGAMSTQVLQPRNLPLWDRISMAFFGRRIELRFPNRFALKSEMIRGLSSAALELVPATFSCDASYRKKNGGVLHCGTCGSCRFRQLALFDAGVSNDAPYAFEVRDKDRIDAARLLHYHAGLISEALSAPQPWEALCLLQSDLRGVDSSDDDRLLIRTRDTIATHQATLRTETISLLARHVAAVERWEEPHRAA